MDKALSGYELLNLIDGKANILKYVQLRKYNTIESAMKPYGALIILYETRKNYGHWVCLIQRDDGIEFFDSYGLKPDDELKFVPEYFRRSYYGKLPHLTFLLLKSGQPIFYNDQKLQKKMKDIKTCGRWVALRIVLRHLSLDDFVDTVRSWGVNNTDFLATVLTI